MIQFTCCGFNRSYIWPFENAIQQMRFQGIKYYFGLAFHISLIAKNFNRILIFDASCLWFLEDTSVPKSFLQISKQSLK